MNCTVWIRLFQVNIAACTLVLWFVPSAKVVAEPSLIWMVTVPGCQTAGGLLST
jgi:hypothetical protein